MIEIEAMGASCEVQMVVLEACWAALMSILDTVEGSSVFIVQLNSLLDSLLEPSILSLLIVAVDQAFFLCKISCNIFLTGVYIEYYGLEYS